MLAIRSLDTGSWTSRRREARAVAEEPVVVFTTKELITRLEDSLGAKIDALTNQVDKITNLHEQEIRDVRHRVVNLEAERALRARLDLENEIARDKVSALEKDAASKQAVDSYRRYLFGVVFLAVVGILLNAYQLVFR